MRIAVYGAGGVGGYFGGRLAQAGADVTFIARGEHLRAMEARGLQVTSICGDFTISPVQVTDNPATPGTVDLVLVCVKADQLPRAADDMAPLIGSDSAVLPLLNGVEATRILADRLGREKVLEGYCAILSMIAEPGVIHHIGSDPLVRFGEPDNRRTQRVERILAAFAAAQGLSADIPPNIQSAVWQKFLFIASTSGMGAITASPFGTVRSQPETRAMLKAVMEEIAAVARAMGIDLPAGIVDKTLGFVDTLAAAGTTSMQRDIAAGRPSELEAQCGAVVKLGRDTGVETPITRFIYHCLLPRERRARGEITSP